MIRLKQTFGPNLVESGRGMTGSSGVVDLAALELVIDGELLIQVHRNLRSWLHVYGCKCLAIEFVDPTGDIVDALANDLAHRLIA